MKTLVILLLAVVTCCLPGFAQDDDEPLTFDRNQLDLTRRNVFSFGFLGLKMKLKYENAVDSYLSFGVHGKFYPWQAIQQGVMVEPFFRYYPGGEAPHGGFIQVKVAGGFFKNSNYIYELNTGSQRNFYAVGSGFAGGYQWILGPERHLALDLFGGFHGYYMPGEYAFDVFLFNYVETVFMDVGVRIGIAY